MRRTTNKHVATPPPPFPSFCLSLSIFSSPPFHLLPFPILLLPSPFISLSSPFSLPPPSPLFSHTPTPQSAPDPAMPQLLLKLLSSLLSPAHQLTILTTLPLPICTLLLRLLLLLPAPSPILHQERPMLGGWHIFPCPRQGMA